MGKSVQHIFRTTVDQNHQLMSNDCFNIIEAPCALREIHLYTTVYLLIYWLYSIPAYLFCICSQSTQAHRHKCLVCYRHHSHKVGHKQLKKEPNRWQRLSYFLVPLTCVFRLTTLYTQGVYKSDNKSLS